MKKLLIGSLIMFCGLGSFTFSNFTYYQCNLSTKSNDCFIPLDSEHNYGTDKNKEYVTKNFDVTTTVDSGTVTIGYIGNTLDISTTFNQGDIFKIDYDTIKYTGKTNGFKFSNFNLKRNGNSIYQTGNITVNRIAFSDGSNAGIQFINTDFKNPTSFTFNMNNSSFQVTDQLSALMSGKFVAMLTTIIAIIAVFVVIVKYVLKAIYKK